MTDDGRVRGRVLAWGGGAVAVAAVAGFGAYFAAAGLDKANQVAGVARVFISVAGLAVSVYGILQARRGTAAARVNGRQAVISSTVARGVTQISRILGNVRIGRASSPSAAVPPASAPAVPSASRPRSSSGVPEAVIEASEPGGGQSVADSQVDGEVIQVDGVGGDVDIDR